MRLIVEEYFDILISIIGGLIIIAITISSIVSTRINIYHNEEKNHFDLQVEKIGEFSCKDVLLPSDNNDLLKDVTAVSNSNIDIKDKVITRIIEVNNKKYVEYVLKYCDDYKVLRSILYEQEDSE